MRNVCVFCGGDVEKRITRVIIDTGDELLVVENVPAGVCTQCGEKEFSPEVVRRLEYIRRERVTADKELRVPVVEFETVPQ